MDLVQLISHLLIQRTAFSGWILNSDEVGLFFFSIVPFKIDFSDSTLTSYRV